MKRDWKKSVDGRSSEALQRGSVTIILLVKRMKRRVRTPNRLDEWMTPRCGEYGQCGSLRPCIVCLLVLSSRILKLNGFHLNLVEKEVIELLHVLEIVDTGALPFG